MRVSTLFVSAIALVGLAVTPAAEAGEYYSNGYYNAGYSNGYYRSGYSNGYYGNGYNRGNVSYSSSCCYQKVVRHHSTTRYVRTNGSSYNGNGYYRSSYYGGPRRYSYDNYYAPPRYDSYAPRRYVGYSGYNGYGYNGYTRANYGSECYSQRVRISDGYGGWVWASRRVCN